jgi:molybdopterin-guanine dinucleotide biosynthesis protein A
MRERITGVVLAGGRGQRMGGLDKGLITFRGRPLVEHVIERLMPQVEIVIISANRNLDSYARYGVPVIRDLGIRGEFQGPLAGIAAAMRAVRTQWLLSVPCDCPGLPLNLAQRLYRGLTATDASIAVAYANERVQPLFALLRTSLCASLESYLATGSRKVERWLNEQGYVRVDFSDESHAFANINTPRSLLALEQGHALNPP